MTAYFITLAAMAAPGFLTGWWLGWRRTGLNGRLSPLAAGTAIGLGLFWFVAASLARSYADMNGAGSPLAEWFAHSGKWLVLFAAAAAGNGYICGAKQIPPTSWRRVFYFAALSGLAGLVVWRTMPVYFLLGDGRRDERGFMRQSAKYEFTCGAVALLNYLERYQHHSTMTEREVSRVCGVTAEGTTISALVNAARQSGLTHATARVLKLEELDQTRLPVIVSISTLPTVHHATLLVSLDEKEADFIDPAYGSWKISRERFRQIWYGKTVRFE